MHDCITEGTLPITAVQTSPDMQRFCDINIMLAQKNSLLISKNSKLWFQYMEMLDILRKFLKAERTGNWKLYLQAIHEILPYLAASGHNLYTKSVYLYLQDMIKLQQLHPEVHAHFLQDYHVIRRSNCFWAGLPLDLAIEKILIKSVKTTGGLTRGRGMSEIQRFLVWLFSRPGCLEINNTMQKFSSVFYSTSDHCKEATQARMERDLKDIKLLLAFLTERNPFSDDPALRNIVTGVTAAADTVNAENPKAVGTAIVNEMVGKNVIEHSFKKKNQIVNMASNNAIKVSNELVSIDPQVLFQRLVTAGMSNEQLPKVFQYELSRAGQYINIIVYRDIKVSR